MLEIAQVSVEYGRARALSDVSIKVDTRAVVGLIGSNGAGKSTMLNCISGLKRPVSGSISWDGQSLTKLSSTHISRSGIVQVPEGRQVFSGMSVLENLELGGRQLAKVDRRVAIEEQFDLFPMLREKRSENAGELSGGQQQMLAIARGLVARPKLLLLDEPSLGLAPIIADEVFVALGVLRDRGITVLMVEQNAARALDIVDYCYVLEQGRIVTSGPSDALRHDPSIIEHYLAAPSGGGMGHR